MSWMLKYEGTHSGARDDGHWVSFPQADLYSTKKIDMDSFGSSDRPATAACDSALWYVMSKYRSSDQPYFG